MKSDQIDRFVERLNEEVEEARNSPETLQVFRDKYRIRVDSSMGRVWIQSETTKLATLEEAKRHHDNMKQVMSGTSPYSKHGDK